jgi:NADH:ubiquinone oxidoreductase subunit E
MIDSMQDIEMLKAPEEASDGLPRILVCVNSRPDRPSCAGGGAMALVETLEAAALARGLKSSLKKLVCLGHCSTGPVVRITGGRYWMKTSLKDIPDIVEALAAARRQT